MAATPKRNFITLPYTTLKKLLGEAWYHGVVAATSESPFVGDDKKRKMYVDKVISKLKKKNGKVKISPKEESDPEKEKLFYNGGIGNKWD